MFKGMKEGLAGIVMGAATFLLVMGIAHGEERNQSTVATEVKADEILAKYRMDYGVGENSSQIMGGQIKHPAYKALFDSDCRSDIRACKLGWDAFKGKIDAAYKEIFVDALKIAQWGGRHGCAKVPQDGNNQVCGPKGDRWVFKIEGPHSNGSISATAAHGLHIFGVDGAADSIVATIADEQKANDLWGKGMYHPIDALFYMGAKSKLGDMLKTLKWTSKHKNVTHVKHLLMYLHTWSLSEEEVEQVASHCNELFENSEAHVREIAACVRYLGLVGSKNSDAREFITSYAAGQGDSWVTIHAIRSVAGLNEKGAKSNLQENLKKAYSKRSYRVKKGKKYIKKDRDTWNANFNAVESAVALFGMGDKKAKKAIEFWTGFEERGGSQQFVHGQGFRLLARDANFAEPKSKKKLTKLLSKAFKKALKYSKDSSGMSSDLFSIALGLTQLGDKAALGFLMEYVTGKKGRESDINQILESWGGDPNDIMHGGNSKIGIGHLPVGGEGFSVKDATKVATTLKKRMKFLRDKRMRRTIMTTVLDIMARVKAVENKL
jgi:hypothetical protein